MQTLRQVLKNGMSLRLADARGSVTASESTLRFGAATVFQPMKTGGVPAGSRRAQHDAEGTLMKRSVFCVLLLSGSTLLAADASNAQTDRGRQWFLHSSKGMACATCHSLEGNGNAIGPDLTRLGSIIGPRGLNITINMSLTAYVQQVVLENGHSFSGLQKQKIGDVLEIYDLSKVPAVLLRLKSSEVASMKTNTKWTHPPASAGYTPQELADIIAYLKFVSTGVAKEVTVNDLH
jgi:putative heme-binding domain-containing protein